MVVLSEEVLWVMVVPNYGYIKWCWCWMMGVLSDVESTLTDGDIITFKPWQTCPLCIQGFKISVFPFANFLCSTTVLPLMNVTSAVGRSFFKSVLYCTARTSRIRSMVYPHGVAQQFLVSSVACLVCVTCLIASCSSASIINSCLIKLCLLQVRKLSLLSNHPTSVSFYTIVFVCNVLSKTVGTYIKSQSSILQDGYEIAN